MKFFKRLTYKKNMIFFFLRILKAKLSYLYYINIYIYIYNLIKMNIFIPWQFISIGKRTQIDLI
jgi:hypothetical protein